MSDYLRALKALGWLNINTDYRVNNLQEGYVDFEEVCDGLFSLSIFSTKASIGLCTGKELIALAEKEGWKDE
jgi:hypothetical protein